MAREDVNYSIVEGTEFRTTAFLVGDDLFVEQKLSPTPFMPPREKHFDLFFFRQLFDHMQHQTMKAEVPLPALRNASIKLMDAMQIQHGFRVNFFGVEKAACSWCDLRSALINVGHPRIELTPVERVYDMLENNSSSKMAKCWFYFIMMVTLANLLGIILPDLSAQTCELVHGIDGDACAESFKTTCLLIFSAEYFTKLICSPFVRREVIFPEQIGYLYSTEWSYDSPTKSQRVWTFATQGPNIIDLVSILPFWLTITIGDLLPSASFLRMLRLARLFRIFKTARYLDMLQVIAMTLSKSGGMVLTLFCLISVIGLICGCLFQQLEAHDVPDTPFTSVTHASYWVFVRLISMKDVPGYKGQIASTAGIIVLAATMALKGVLWIVPIARIKQIFAEEYAEVIKIGTMRRNMLQELLDFNDTSDQNKLITPQGTTWAVMKFQGVEVEADEVHVPLPILTDKKCDVDIDVPVPLPGGTEVRWKMSWTPSVSMAKAGGGMPDGKLVMQIVSSRNLPNSITGFSLEVPTTTFGNSEKQVSWRSDSASDLLEFTIKWEAEAKEPIHEAPGSTATQHGTGLYAGKLDTIVWQQKVLKSLEDQQLFLKSQAKLVGDTQARLVALEQS